MAYILKPEEKQAAQVNNGILQGESGGVIGGGTSGSGDAMSTRSPGASIGAFPDVAAYLDANKDSAVSQFQGAIGSAAQGIKDQFGNEINDFKKNVDTSRPAAFDQNIVNSILNDPINSANDPAKLAAFKAYGSANYGGPSSFSGSKDVTGKANDLIGAKSIDELLPRVYGQNANVTQGMRSLDNLLYGSLQNPMETLTGQAFSGLKSYMDDQTKGANDYAKSASDLAANERSAYGGVKNTFETNSNDLNNQRNGEIRRLAVWNQANGYPLSQDALNQILQKTWEPSRKPIASSYEKILDNPNLFSWV